MGDLQDLDLPSADGVQEEASQDFYHAVASPHIWSCLCHCNAQFPLAASQSTAGQSVVQLVASSRQAAAEVQTEQSSPGHIFQPVSKAVELRDRNTKLAAKFKSRIMGFKDEA